MGNRLYPEGIFGSLDFKFHVTFIPSKKIEQLS